MKPVLPSATQTSVFLFFRRVPSFIILQVMSLLGVRCCPHVPRPSTATKRNNCAPFLFTWARAQQLRERAGHACAVRALPPPPPPPTHTHTHTLFIYIFFNSLFSDCELVQVVVGFAARNKWRNWKCLSFINPNKYCVRSIENSARLTKVDERSGLVEKMWKTYLCLAGTYEKGEMGGGGLGGGGGGGSSSSGREHDRLCWQLTAIERIGAELDAVWRGLLSYSCRATVIVCGWWRGQQNNFRASSMAGKALTLSPWNERIAGIPRGSRPECR